MAFFLVCMWSLLLIYLASYIFQLLADARHHLPPGPTPLPLIGNLLHVAGELPHRSLARLAERHGPLMKLRLGTVLAVVASSPSTAREVLQTHNTSLTGRVPPDAWRGAGHAANSVFVLPPRRKWRALRRIGAEHLLSPRLLDGRLRPLLKDTVLGLLRRVSELAAAAGGAPVEVGRPTFAALMDLQWRAMFSTGLDDDDANDADAAAAARALQDNAREAIALSLKPNVSDFFPALVAVDLQGLRHRFARRMETVYRLMDEQIERRVRCRREAAAAGGAHRKDDLLDVLLDMSEQDVGDSVVAIDRGVLRTFLTDIFLATVDAISSAIEWAMAELLQNPETMRKLQEELRRVLGYKTHAEYSDMDRLPYLRAVVKETLRLHPVVPMVPNVAEETVQIHGHTVPKGSTVLVNMWAVHRDAEAWPEPDRFSPERFLPPWRQHDGNRKAGGVGFLGTGTAESFELIPFSGGRRGCLGLPLATRMLHAMLGSLLHRFQWTLPPAALRDGLDMSENLGLTMTMATPLQAIAKSVV